MSKIDSPLKIQLDKIYDPLTVNQVNSAEALLYLMEKLCPGEDPYKAYLLLSGYHLIGIEETDPSFYFIQQAKQTGLYKYGSKRQWQELLREYALSKYDSLRAYKIIETATGHHILERSPSKLFYPFSEREEFWLSHYFETEKDKIFEPTNNKKTEPGRYRAKVSYLPVVKGPNISESQLIEKKTDVFEFKLDVMPDPVSEKIPIELHEKASITISVNDLLNAAKEIAQIIPDDYSYNVLKENTLLKVQDHRVAPDDKFTLKEITNVVGMVGAGKSTLIKVLSYWLSKNGYRTVIVTDTVASVLQLIEYFDKLNVYASPLIGRSDRKRYIEQMYRPGSTCLSALASRYLTTSCFIDGLTTDQEEPCIYGKEPCRDIQKIIPGKDRSIKQVCPFFNDCPSTKMLIDCYHADIVVTTAAGLATSRVGASNELFMDVAFHLFDLVIFDESDRIQQTLDNHFLETVSFNEFIKDATKDIADFSNQDFSEKMDKPALQKYDNFLRLTSIHMSKLIHATEQQLGGWNQVGANTIFSSLSLLNDLRDREEISENIYQEILALIMPMKSAPMLLERVTSDSLNGVYPDTDPESFTNGYKEWLREKVNTFPYPDTDEEMTAQNNKLALIIKLIQFDRYLNDLTAASEAAKEEDTSALYNFMKSRFTQQQRMLPSALTGNLLGIQINDKKDLILYKQFAFGRSLMKDLSYLKVTKDGKPAGPHVLLLSGSSWAEGSLTYHVNRPVNYILDIPEKKKEFLAKTKFYFPRSDIRVSGSGSPEMREQNLRELTHRSLSLIIEAYNEHTGKLLLVVNSYMEGEKLHKILVQFLCENGCQAKVAHMIPDREEGENASESIRRSEISNFAISDADILIAPALAIERGHNIVDDDGHSAITHLFFMVRPMSVPDSLELKAGKINGIIEKRYQYHPGYSVVEHCSKVRSGAVKQWNMMNTSRHLRIADLSKLEKKDIVASLFIMILQVFGRLARVTDPEKPAPQIYFLDGAFRASGKRKNEFDCIKEFGRFLDGLMHGVDADIAKALYEPFAVAYERALEEEGGNLL